MCFYSFWGVCLMQIMKWDEMDWIGLMEIKEK